jgi:hypothetical protein
MISSNSPLPNCMVYTNPDMSPVYSYRPFLPVGISLSAALPHSTFLLPPNLSIPVPHQHTFIALHTSHESTPSPQSHSIPTATRPSYYQILSTHPTYSSIHSPTSHPSTTDRCFPIHFSSVGSLQFSEPSQFSLHPPFPYLTFPPFFFEYSFAVICQTKMAVITIYGKSQYTM